MNIYFKCPNCETENRLKTDATTRVEFAMKKGNVTDLKCCHCHQTTSFKVNKLYAKESKLISILAGIIFIIGTAIGLYFLMKMISEMKFVMSIFLVATGLLAPIWIFNILNKEERTRVKTFNQTYVKE